MKLSNNELIKDFDKDVVNSMILVMTRHLHTDTIEKILSFSMVLMFSMMILW